MKKVLLALVVLFTIVSNTKAQNVGVGDITTPTNTLHVRVNPLNPDQNPVRFEGLQLYTTENNLRP